MAEKKAPKKSNLKGVGYFFGCIFLLILFAAFITLLILGAIWGKPQIEEFLRIQVPKIERSVEITSEESVIVDAIEATQNSVVTIAVSQLQLSSDGGLVDESNEIGTGFIVDDSGLVITNQHVVSEDTEYRVITADGKEHKVLEIVRDDINDIALLKISSDDLEAVDLGNSDNLEVGQLVIAIGTPLGEYSGSATSGIISGLNRSVTARSGFSGGTTKQYEDVIQTDAAINPGNSGGPLISSSGKVIGVNFATTEGADNISFALPINRVAQRLSEYRKYGKFLTPYLGVEYQIISQATALRYENIVPGALVIRVSAQSPASQAGIERADIITKIGDDKINSSLVSLIQKHDVGDEIDIEIWRDGETLTLTATLEEQ